MIGLRLLGITLAPFGAVLLLMGGWWPVRMGEGSAWVLRRALPDHSASADVLSTMAFVLTPAGAVVLAASLALVTWPRR